MQELTRASIISLHATGKKLLVIANSLGVPVRSVRYAIKRYKEIGGLQDRPRSGRPVTIRTTRNKDVIKKRIQRNPRRSMRGLAKSLKISERSVRRIVKDDLGYRSYKFIKGQALTDAN